MTQIEFHVNQNTGDTAVYADGKLIAEGNRLDAGYVAESLGYSPFAVAQVDTNRVSGGSLTGLPTFLDNLDGGQPIPFYTAESITVSRYFADDVLAKAAAPIAPPATEDEFFERMKSMRLGKNALIKDNKILKRVAPEQAAPDSAFTVSNELASAVTYASAVPEEPKEDPIGIRLPRIGEDVYVEGFNSIFRAVQGGLGKVKMLVSRNPDGTYEQLNAQSKGEADLSVFRPENNNDEDEDDEDDYYRGSSSSESDDANHIGLSNIDEIFVVVEESPLDMFNWKDLKYSQESLKKAYGDLRVVVEIDKLNPEPEGELEGGEPVFEATIQ